MVGPMLAATPTTAATNLTRMARAQAEVVRLAVSSARGLLAQAAVEAKPAELRLLIDEIDCALGQLEVYSVAIACAEQEPTPADVLDQVLQVVIHALCYPVEPTPARHRGNTLAADRIAAWVRRANEPRAPVTVR
jgi:hypothetical protein